MMMTFMRYIHVGDGVLHVRFLRRLTILWDEIEKVEA